MAVTRLKRKAKRNKTVSKTRVKTIQRLNSKPVIKQVDVEEIKAEFKKGGSKPAAKTKVKEPKVEAKAVKEEVKSAPKAEKKEVKAAKPKAKAKGDDLKKIEGIGPKIAEKFNEAGINSFADLAAASVDKLKEILEEAGSRYKSHDPTTWPQQAGLAADGKWDELKTLQDELDGGK